MLPLFQRPRCLRTLCESKWIHTVQWIVIITFICVNSVSCKRVCTKHNLFSLQRHCREENDDLVSNVGTNHTQQLCSALSKLWLCVARSVPPCFDNMTKIHQSLTHSPHNCQISKEDFRRIQQIINDSEKKDKTTITIIQETSHMGSTTIKADNGDDDGYTVNNNSSHLGTNAGVSLRSCNSVMILLLIPLVTISLSALPVL